MKKTVLITKSSQGLGPKIAETLVSKGCNVIIHYNYKQEQANALVEKLGNHKAIAVQANPEKSKDVDILIKLATKHFGQIDAVINNNLITSEDKILPSEDLIAIDLVTKQLMKQFIQQQDGTIINLHNSPETANDLVTLFTNNLATEFKQQGIRVNSISSNLTEECLIKSTPTRQNITDIVSFLISDHAINITGKNINIKNNINKKES